MVQQAELFPETPKEIGLTLEPKLDAAMQAAWQRACDYCRGPGLKHVSVELFMLGLLTANETRIILQQSYQVDIRAARDKLRLDDEPTGQFNHGQYSPTDRLLRVFFIAAADAAAKNSSIIGAANFIEALGQLDDERQLAKLIPKHRERMINQVLARRVDKKLQANRAALAAIERKVGEGATEAELKLSVESMKSILTSISTKLAFSPGLDLDVEKLRGSFGNVHGRFDDLERKAVEADTKLADIDRRIGQWPVQPSGDHGMRIIVQQIADQVAALSAKVASLDATVASRLPASKGWFWQRSS